MIPKPVRTKDRKLLDAYQGLRCVVCNRTGAVAHHVRSKGASGPDESWNLMPLCGIDHNRVHAIGLTRFAENYINAKNWLVANGWTFDEYKGKWTHYD